MYSLDEFLKNAKQDPNFNLFIQQNDEAQILEQSVKLKKLYDVLIHCKNGVYWECKTFTPFEIVANMGLLTHVDVLLMNVYEKINKLDKKGQDLIRAGLNSKGEKAQDLAMQIKRLIDNLKECVQNDKRDTLDKFSSTSSYKLKISQDISKLIKDGYKTMGSERNLCDILAHICLALTGIGLLLIIANKIYSGSLFFNNTERQSRLKGIEQDLAVIIQCNNYQML